MPTIHLRTASFVWIVVTWRYSSTAAEAFSGIAAA